MWMWNKEQEIGVAFYSEKLCGVNSYGYRDEAVAAMTGEIQTLIYKNQ